MWFRSIPCLLLALAADTNAEVHLNFDSVAEIEFPNAEEFGSAFNEHIRPALQMMNFSTLPFADDPKLSNTCMPCVKAVAMDVILKAGGELMAMCNHVKRESLQRLCKDLSNAPKVAVGILIVHARPFSLALEYCKGHGDCSNPSLDEEALETLEDEHAQGELFGQHLESIIDHHRAIEETRELLEGSLEDEREACVERASTLTMSIVVHHLYQYCEKAKKPTVQRRCHWARKHKETAFGMLLMKVEPWKFAMGFCLAKHIFHDHSSHIHHEKSHKTWKRAQKWYKESDWWNGKSDAADTETV